MATHRAFTVEAANQLIPWVESVFLRLDGHRQRSLKHSEGTQILEVMWGDRIGSPDNPDHDEYLRHRRAMEEVARTVQGVIEQDLIAVEAACRQAASKAASSTSHHLRGALGVSVLAAVRTPHHPLARARHGVPRPAGVDRRARHRHGSGRRITGRPRPRLLKLPCWHPKPAPHRFDCIGGIVKADPGRGQPRQTCSTIAGLHPAYTFQVEALFEETSCRLRRPDL